MVIRVLFYKDPSWLYYDYTACNRTRSRSTDIMKFMVESCVLGRTGGVEHVVLEVR